MVITGNPPLKAPIKKVEEDNNNDYHYLSTIQSIAYIADIFNNDNTFVIDSNISEYNDAVEQFMT